MALPMEPAARAAGVAAALVRLAVFRSVLAVAATPPAPPVGASRRAVSKAWLNVWLKAGPALPNNPPLNGPAPNGPAPNRPAPPPELAAALTLPAALVSACTALDSAAV